MTDLYPLEAWRDIEYNDNYVLPELKENENNNIFKILDLYKTNINKIESKSEDLA